MKKLLALVLVLSVALNVALLLHERKHAPLPAAKPKPAPAVSVPAPPAAPTIEVTSPKPGPAPSPAPAPPPETPQGVVVTASPGFVASRGLVTVSCHVVPRSRPSDWIGLFAVGAGDTQYTAWQAVNEGAQGFIVFHAPETAGTYEFRYMRGSDNARLATSNPVVVSGTPPADKPVVTISITPLVARPGETISVTWTVHGGRRRPQDWIGLYECGKESTAYVTWKYVDADQGTMTFEAPKEGESYYYEARYLLDNGYGSAASSPPLTLLR